MFESLTKERCLKLAAMEDGQTILVMPFEPYQQRVVTEKDELDLKIDSLKNFIYDDNNKLYAGLSGNEQVRLLNQLEVMKSYSKILGERIAAFEDRPADPELKL